MGEFEEVSEVRVETITAARKWLCTSTPDVHVRSMAPYEKLHAWRECHELALAVYKATARFPVEERYGLVSQARRAAFSAAVNIVEGGARRSPKEFRRFLDISLSSLSETGYVLRFARDVGLLSATDWAALDDRQNRAHFLTWRLYRAVGRRTSKTSPPSPTSQTSAPSNGIRR